MNNFYFKLILSFYLFQSRSKMSLTGGLKVVSDRRPGEEV